MMYKWIYKTPEGLDDIILESDGKYLNKLIFFNSKDEDKLCKEAKEKNLEIFKETSKWLDIYFSSKNLNFTLKYKIKNLTPFRQEVTDIMNSIEYGKVVTCNDISK